ncbi:MAG: hypothetical protein J0I52_02600 [Bordetella sp.]|nr:hypothetical protein [Bordetella sp.]
MGDTFRAILLIALIAAFLTTGVLLFSWWMESERRLRRAMKKALGAPADTLALSVPEGRAAGLDLEGGQLVVLWSRGAMGLVYAFEEVLGAEIIVDGHVVARVLRGQMRKEIDLDAPDAELVVLRLIFSDPHNAEFELALWNGTRTAPASEAEKTSGARSPGEGLRLGRRWLSHVEALMQR